MAVAFAPSWPGLALEPFALRIGHVNICFSYNPEKYHKLRAPEKEWQGSLHAYQLPVASSATVPVHMLGGFCGLPEFFEPFWVSCAWTCYAMLCYAMLCYATSQHPP